MLREDVEEKHYARFEGIATNVDEIAGVDGQGHRVKLRAE